MGLAIAVQFYGAENVVKAFEYKGIPTWAIFQGKALIHKCVGKSMEEACAVLEEFLGMIGTHSTAVYTLKVYEDAGRIKENTPCDGSFNFRLVDEKEREERNTAYRGAQREILARLEAIEARLQGGDDDDDDEGDKLSGVLTELLREPSKIGQLIDAGKSLLGLISSPKVIPMQKVGSVNPEPPAQHDDKLQAAIETLQRNDPRIAEHLAKLAALSENDKATFQYLLTMLDKM